MFSLSLTPDISNDVRKEMIGEAQNILESSYTIGKSVLLRKLGVDLGRIPGQNKSNYHKWLAVISNTKNGLDSLETKVREYPVIRDNLIKACESNPNDFSGNCPYLIHFLTGDLKFSTCWGDGTLKWPT